ncbi:putative adhesin [Endozoicomonas lisbonensis]|uniref:Putative adhesin Stv domain-containing protein n=1 Tax=Endozoicomonas lisbonensis TaxID=3120522 RepID=A0ABV2SJB2_9GAMM
MPVPLSKETLDKMHSRVLNGKLKLFTYDRFGFDVQNLIILAHGGAHNQNGLPCAIQRLMGTYYFKSPVWTTLFFYSPHGTVTFGGLLSFMDGTYRPFEAYIPGEPVINYALFHSVDQRPSGSDEHIQFCLYQSRCGSGPDFIHHPFRIFDIVTVEPSGSWGISLKDVLDTLFLTGNLYPRVHCTFCRNEYRTEKRYYEPTYDYMKRYRVTHPL